MLLSAGPASLIGQVRHGRPITAAREALAFARAERTSSTRVLLEMLQFWRDSYRQSLLRAAKLVRARAIDPTVDPEVWKLELNWVWPLRSAGWLTDETARLVCQRVEVHLFAVVDRDTFDDDCDRRPVVQIHH